MSDQEDDIPVTIERVTEDLQKVFSAQMAVTRNCITHMLEDADKLVVISGFVGATGEARANGIIGISVTSSVHKADAYAAIRDWAQAQIDGLVN